MNYKYAVIFGADYEGESFNTLKLFENLDDIDGYVSDTEVIGYNDYYMLGELAEDGTLKFFQRIDL